MKRHEISRRISLLSDSLLGIVTDLWKGESWPYRGGEVSIDLDEAVDRLEQQKEKLEKLIEEMKK